jgi:triphosphoribosyl-dephospho-CoA synthase
MITAQQLGELYLRACEIELQAFKPGNVSVYADGHGMTVDDFRTSAAVSAAPLCNLNYGLGEKIYEAVKATREAVGCNTNLGIILLCAPLIEAACLIKPDTSLRQALQTVLANTSQTDADWVFKAISLAAPGGLGSASEQDVNGKASVTLTEAMALAAPRDRIASQYVSNYRDIFDFSAFVFYNARARWGDENWAAVAVYANLLSQFPDSHIERKYGNQYSALVAGKMRSVCDAISGADQADVLTALLYSIDCELKSKGINPGTTADLTVATVFSVLLEDYFAFK